MMAIPLAAQDFAVDQAATVDEAISLLRANGYDLVLTDYNLRDALWSDARRCICRPSTCPRRERKAEADNVIFTPTIVKNTPPPRAWLMGHLGATEVLPELLESSGIDLSHSP